MSTKSSESFHQLLRHHLVNTLGWSELRPLQELSAGPILAGEHALVLAPTAGGKTEAAIFPAISQLLTEGWIGTSIIYLCPLKALLNNLHERLETYFGMIGHEVGLWHGDIPTSARNRIVANKPACLLTTPESLEVMLISQRQELKELLVNIRMVIVDEIHAFAGDDRGLHLLSVIERVRKLSGREFQRIGLSATVGNPEALLCWLAGHCEGSRRVISVDAANVEADVRVDYVKSLENAAYVISQLHQGEKRLVFCDSRRRVEELAIMLREHGIDTFISHSSLSVEQRRDAEEAFRSRSNCVIVSTSTLELGIDVGDLDRVIQIDAPGTVASFLQRIGRTGRRPGSSRNCLFLATSNGGLLQATALVSLWEKGFVEPIIPPRVPYHILVQQILALTLQKSGIRKEAWREWIGRIPCYAAIPQVQVDRLINHLLEREILFSDGVLLSIGDQGASQFGRQHFLELVSVFTSPPLFEVLHGSKSIGMVDWLSVARQEGKERKPMVLAARAWDIIEIDFKTRRIFVMPSEKKGKAQWQGEGRGLSFELSQEVREILLWDGLSIRWTKRCADQITSLRNEYLAQGIDSTNFIYDDTDHQLKWWTFAGRFINESIALVLDAEACIEAKFDDYSLTFSHSVDGPKVRKVIRKAFEDPNVLNLLPVSKRWIDGLKFSECLPESLAADAARGRIHVSDKALAYLQRIIGKE